MPVLLDRDPSGSELLKRTNGLVAKPPDEFRESDARCIDIGLFNNMPDGALQSTERQFLTLLEQASAGIVVRVSLFSLSDIPRGESGRRYVGSLYSGMDNLFDRHLDALIVTGTEPRTPNLKDEPYWESLTRVLDWADHNTHSTVLSCLAAHAAVLHFDGISRRRLGEKRFGLFGCVPIGDHPLTAGVPAHFPMPQSRWNEIPERQLADRGYLTLTRAGDTRVEMQVNQRRSLFVLFQGHPEYEANTLLLEYRRDVGRYLRGERSAYPPMPRRYFDANTADALRVLQLRALRERREELLADFPTARAEKERTNTWRSTAACIYGNWLSYLCQQKRRQLRRQSVRGSLLGRLVEAMR